MSDDEKNPWNPTLRMRFVKRAVPAPELGTGVNKTSLILQQQHHNMLTGEKEWQDVPLVDEPA